jgi:hypothetical protein
MVCRAYFILAALLLGSLALTTTPVSAQYELKEITPSVKSALDRRKNRFESLEALKADGTIGENNKGYVSVLKENEEAADLAEMENMDRKTIYKAVAEQNNIVSEMAVIESTFAKVQREKAKTGEMVQLENGEWAAK